MPVTEHLEELRGRIWIVVLSGLVAWAAAFFFSDDLVKILAWPLRRASTLAAGSLYFFSPAEAFLIKLKAAGFASLLLTFPVALDQLRRFVAPALERRHRKWLALLPGLGWLLFLAGSAFAFFGVLPFGLRFLLGQGGETIRPLLSVGKYLGFVLWVCLACGAIFEWPLVVWILARTGVLEPELLARGRRFAFMGILILAAAISPGPDVFTQLLLAFPGWLLYEAGVWIARWAAA